METVQPSVLHLDHGGMPPQSQMAYPQRSSHHRYPAQDSFHPQQRPSSGSSSSLSTSPAVTSSSSTSHSPSGNRSSNYPHYSSAPRDVLRYIPQPPYGGTVGYRENPYISRNAMGDNQQLHIQATMQQSSSASLPPPPPPPPPPQPPPPTSQQQHEQQSQQQGHSPQQIQVPSSVMQQQQLQLPPLQGPVQSVPALSQSQASLQQEYSHTATPPNSRNRISLIPPPNTEYVPSVARSRNQQPDQYKESGQHVLPSSSSLQIEGVPPFKKIRLGEVKQDTQEPSNTESRVENISPTLPVEGSQDDVPHRTTKDELLQRIGKVDREIAKTESQISNLKKIQTEVEKTANEPLTKKEEEEIIQPKHRSVAQQIYAENRRVSYESHASLSHLGPHVELPLYNQPSDTAVYHENKRKYNTFRFPLLEHLKRRMAEKEAREKYLTRTYSRMMREWLRKVEKAENSQKRKAREAKNREFFEKVFPELRKQREDRERFNRVGARIKSEADLEEFMDGLQEQANEEKKMHAYAVIPPIVFDARQRRQVYISNNGRIDDFKSELKGREFRNVWTDTEKEIFKEKYLQHPKNFNIISSYLERKNVADCVQHYYLVKKRENFKQQLRKARQKTRAGRNNQHAKPPVSTRAPTPVTSESVTAQSGVTTRLQKEQQSKQEPSSVGATCTVTSCSTTVTSVTSEGISFGDVASSVNVFRETVQTSVTTSSAVTSAAISVSPCQSATVAASTVTTVVTAVSVSIPIVTVTPPTSLDTSHVSCSSASTSVCIASSYVKTEPAESGIIEADLDTSFESEDRDMHQVDEAVVEEMLKTLKTESGHLLQVKDAVISNKSSIDESVSDEKCESKKKDRKKNGKRKRELETSEEEAVNTRDKNEVVPCIICKVTLDNYILHSRALSRSHAAQYGLTEDEVPPGARVCNNCRCKTVRNRYTHCTLPTCPNGKGRVKRLRPFPTKWTEIPQDLKDSIIAEYKIPPNVNKCCTACFNRINRRIAPHVQEANPVVEASVPVTTAEITTHSQHIRWHDEEIDSLKRALRDFGTNWHKVAEQVATTKTQHQCKNFYFNYRKKLGLDLLVQEFHKGTVSEERKPTVTDEEESGSSTSSCDEMTGAQVNSDTDSAVSPSHAQTAGDIKNSEDATKLDIKKETEETHIPSKGVQEESIVTQSQTLPAPPPVTTTTTTVTPVAIKEDYDSSATETADEGQGGADGEVSTSRHSPKSSSNYLLSASTIAPPPTQTELNGPVQARRGPSPMRSVKDLMLSAIEVQLMKNNQSASSSSDGSSITPTITSILRTDSNDPRRDVSYDIRESKQRQQHQAEAPLVTVSLVNSRVPTSAHQPPSNTNVQMQPTSQYPSADLPKEGLVVLQVQQALRETEGVTLDLSIKKPRDQSPLPSLPAGHQGDTSYQQIHHTQLPPPQPPLPPPAPPSVAPHMEPPLPPHTSVHNVPPPAHCKTGMQPSVTIYRTSGTHGESSFYSHPGSSASSKLSPKLISASAKGGSITHGTPGSVTTHLTANAAHHIAQQHQQQISSRYEGLLRMTPPQQIPSHGKDGSIMGGSITQGTPVHHLSHHAGEKRAVYDYYKRSSPAGGTNLPNLSNSSYGVYQRDAAPSGHTTSAGTFTSPFPPPVRPPGYATPQQIISRQIIMNDYITSQQMDVSRRVSNVAANVSIDKSSSQDSASPRGVSSSPHYFHPLNAQSLYCRSPASSNVAEQPSTPPRHANTPPRQGVIQRHNPVPCLPPRSSNSGSLVNPKPPSPVTSPHQRLHIPIHQIAHPSHMFPPPLPGHEAFSSLVEMAVQQPSLPVPHKENDKRQISHHPHHHEGLGKSMVDTVTSTRLLVEHQQMQERERQMQERELAIHPDHARYLHTLRDRDSVTEQQVRFHQERYGMSREHEQRYSSGARERDREREREKERNRERERDNQLLHQQQHPSDREYQHRERDILQHQQFHQQRELHQQAQLQQVHHQQQQRHHQSRVSAELDRQRQQQIAAAYREHHQREVPGNSASSRAVPTQQQSSGGETSRDNSRGGSSSRGSAGDSSTLTAASLIDAIITHQINQTSTESSGGGSQGSGSSSSVPPRAGDRLFQSFQRDQPPPQSSQHSSGLTASDSNGKSSPLKSSVSPSVHPVEHEQPTQESSGPGISKNVTLGEHIDSIVAKDYIHTSSAGYSQVPPHHRLPSVYHPYHLMPQVAGTSTADMIAAAAAAEQHNWKLRKVLQQQQKEAELAREREKSSSVLQPDERQIIRIAQPLSPRGKHIQGGTYHVEPVSPPEGVGSHWISGAQLDSSAFISSRRHYLEQPGSKPSHLSPLDYVKNRIVEVMRTSEDDKSEQLLSSLRQQQLAHHHQVFQSKRGSDTVGEEKTGYIFTNPQDLRSRDEKSRHQSHHSEGEGCENLIKGDDRERPETSHNPTDIGLSEGHGPNDSSKKLDSLHNRLPSPNIGVDGIGSRMTAVFPKMPGSNPVSSTFALSSMTSAAAVAAAFAPPATTYTYPYSALNVPSAAHAGQALAACKLAGASSGLKTKSQPTTDRSLEPAPLLSAQYEPLSDED